MFGVFETSRVYLPCKEGLPNEIEHLVGAVTGRRVDRWDRATEEGIGFFDGKACVERLFDRLGISVEYAAVEEYGMIPGRTSRIRAEEKEIGYLGQVHPTTAAYFGVERDVYLFEVALDDLLPLVTPVPHYQPIPRFPPVVEDLAVVVNADVPASQVRVVILGHPLVSSVRAIR